MGTDWGHLTLDEAQAHECRPLRRARAIATPRFALVRRTRRSRQSCSCARGPVRLPERTAAIGDRHYLAGDPAAHELQAVSLLSTVPLPSAACSGAASCFQVLGRAISSGAS